MADSNEVDEAVIAQLTDTPLQTALPGGVFYDIAAGPSTRFVIVSQLGHEEVEQFEDDTGNPSSGVAFERFIYLAKAVEKSTDGPNAKAGAVRIHELMTNRPLVIEGYDWVKTKRVERVRIVEVDDLDKNIRWHHRGGHYEILVSPK